MSLTKAKHQSQLPLEFLMLTAQFLDHQNGSQTHINTQTLR